VYAANLQRNFISALCSLLSRFFLTICVSLLCMALGTTITLYSFICDSDLAPSLMVVLIFPLVFSSLQCFNVQPRSAKYYTCSIDWPFIIILYLMGYFPSNAIIYRDQIRV
jgi:hypothetical protein